MNRKNQEIYTSTYTSNLDIRFLSNKKYIGILIEGDTNRRRITWNSTKASFRLKKKQEMKPSSIVIWILNLNIFRTNFREQSLSNFCKYPGNIFKYKTHRTGKK